MIGEKKVCTGLVCMCVCVLSYDSIVTEKEFHNLVFLFKKTLTDRLQLL